MAGPASASRLPRFRLKKQPAMGAFRSMPGRQTAKSPARRPGFRV
jgi:hypothetical protein